MLTVKQYTRSLLSTVDLRTVSRTSSTVEVRAAGLLLPVAWESSGGIPSCGNCNVLLTLLLLLLLQLCATPVRGAVTLLHNTFLQLLPEALVVVVAVSTRATPGRGAVSTCCRVFAKAVIAC
jgi:hypothetical protein